MTDDSSRDRWTVPGSPGADDGGRAGGPVAPPADPWYAAAPPPWSPPPPPSGPPPGWEPSPWARHPAGGLGQAPRGRGRGAAIVAALVLVSAGAGATASIAVVSHLQGSSSPSATTSTGQTGTSSGSGTGAPPASAAPSGPLDTSTLAAMVDPAVVDITSTLANQGGTAQGTGMVITSNGEILTNNHVIDGASSITVQISGTGPTYPATVLGYDRADDVALLKIQGVSGLKTITVGNSSAVSVGDAVVALGNALGQGGTPAVATGQVTALNQTITASDVGGSNSETLSGLIEIDAAIQPGDSGGPLVDTSGKVVGMDTAAEVTRRFSASTVAYAIPISTAMTIAHQIEAGTSSTNVHIGDRAILGVGVQDAPSAGGAAVTQVVGGSPAASAGITTGDVIVSVGGTAVTSSNDLETAMYPHHPGDRVSVTWLDTSGTRHTATIQATSGPPN